LNKIGAKSTSELTEKALKLVNKENLSKEDFKEQQKNRELEYDDASEQLNELDSKFYEYPDALDNLLVKYIRDNLNMLE
jgi:hypothetical protein